MTLWTSSQKMPVDCLCLMMLHLPSSATKISYIRPLFFLHSIAGTLSELRVCPSNTTTTFVYLLPSIADMDLWFAGTMLCLLDFGWDIDLSGKSLRQGTCLTSPPANCVTVLTPTTFSITALSVPQSGIYCLRDSP